MDSSLSSTISDFYDSFAMLGFSGLFGSDPLKIGRVLTKSGITYSRVSANEMTKPGIYIVSYWNDNAPFNGLHTIAVTYDGSKYTTYNKHNGYFNPYDYDNSSYIIGYYLGE